MTTTPQRFADFQPQDLLTALDAVGLRGDGRVLQLNSYENRVFQVHLEDGSVVVVKVYRPGRWRDEQILEEHGFARELEAAEVPVVAPLSLEVSDPEAVTLQGPDHTLATWRDDTPKEAGQPARHWRFSVSLRKAGRGPELDDPDTVRWIGRFLARLHEVGARHAFEHRRSLSLENLGALPRQWLLDSGHIGPAERAAWADASERALAAAAEVFERRAGVARLRLHGDAHPGNILWRPEGPHVVDLDDACQGPAVQDLWMLLPGDEDGRARQLRLLLEGYETVRDFDDRELALIEPLRTLRMIHHSAWLAQRWDDPAFPLAFPHFGTAAYWSEQTALLREQAAAITG